ncbi:GGDEF domain-containing protein [Alishewanella sp. 16-MA]|uniref:diguanylate cyclase n=1 Tax=Alishewanella maricola TaxID=2795740 RepID=A0ABS8C2Q6_9ALTE|nr:GGDEF domain-containing protein [Alishewanella maricola]MCB5226596.1 GGDEF domain-containing protein [Alishewanella maricola]
MHQPFNKQSTEQAQKIDARRRLYILRFVSYITTAVMFIYGVKNLSAEQILLPTILFTTGSLFLLNIIVFNITRNLDRACVIETLLVASFVLSLVYQGGFNNTALFWVFPFPAILFGLLGVRNALISNAVLLIILSIMLFIPDLISANYKEAEASRFIASLLIVIIVCWINDHYRERSHEAMDKLQQIKDQQANTDQLTNLANRRFIDACLVPSFEKQPDLFFPVSLIMCDIDYFKRLNDNFGHDVGDNVLKSVAYMFKQNIRQQDFACRIGGEEFLLILPRTSVQDALNIADKIRKQFHQQQLVPSAPQYKVTASFGVALCNKSEEFSESIKLADMMLYKAKNNGRDQTRG